MRTMEERERDCGGDGLSFGAATIGRRDGTNQADRREIAFRQKHGRPPSRYVVEFDDGFVVVFTDGYGVTLRMVDEHGKVMKAEEK